MLEASALFYVSLTWRINAVGATKPPDIRELLASAHAKDTDSEDDLFKAEKCHNTSCHKVLSFGRGTSLSTPFCCCELSQGDMEYYHLPQLFSFELHL